MALVTGPMMSLDASGTLAGTMTFAKWKGRNYVRQTVRPSNPQTPLQTAMRAMMRALAQDWKNLSPTEQGGWDDGASSNNYSPFNHYVSVNQSRWRQFVGPLKSPANAAGSGTQPATASALATGGPSNVAISIAVTTLHDAWGIVLHRSAGASAAPSLANAIRVIPITGTGTIQFVDSPLPAGDYYYQFSTFTDDGSAIVDAAHPVNATAT